MSNWIKVPRIVLRELLAEYYGTGTDDVIFDKYSIRVFEPQKHVPDENNEKQIEPAENAGF